MRAIVSGGQTGVDRAALEVARELGIPCGGWCPRGRLAEDGEIPPEYPLRETISAEPAQRTIWNVFDTDATLVLAPEQVVGGTRLAVEAAERLGRPLLHVRPGEPGSADRVREWLRGLPADLLLNVAGPRESEVPGVAETAAGTLREALMDRGEQIAPPRRVLVTGGAGLLGGELIRSAPPGVEVHATQRALPVTGCPAHIVDLAEPGQVTALFDRVRPVLVIHTAYSTVDLRRDIVEATRNVADAAAAVGARVVHLSSDMVLGGDLAPYADDAAAAPVNEYGRAKAEAEGIVQRAVPMAALIRTSLITSFHPPDPRTEWILRGLRDGSGADLFVDEVRCPIPVEDLARQIWEIARLDEGGAAGVWNLAGRESLSRYAIGTLVAAVFRLEARSLRPVSSTSHPDPRPRDLRLLTLRADRDLVTRARGISESITSG